MQDITGRSKNLRLIPSEPNQQAQTHSEIESSSTLVALSAQACKDPAHLSMHSTVGRAGEIRRQRLGGDRTQRPRRHGPPGLRWRRRRRCVSRSRLERRRRHSRRRESPDLRRRRHLTRPRSREWCTSTSSRGEAAAWVAARVCVGERESAHRREGFRKIFRRGRGAVRGPRLYTPQRGRWPDAREEKFGEGEGGRARAPGVRGRGPHDASQSSSSVHPPARENRRSLEGPLLQLAS